MENIDEAKESVKKHLITDEGAEKAAILWCELNDLDPFETIPHSAEPDHNGFVPGILLYSPRWKTMVPEIKRLDSLMESVAAVRRGLK